MEPTNISPAAPASQGFNWKDFISFRSMITLQVIQIVYIIVAILITLTALMQIFGGGGYYSGAGLMGILGGGGVIGGLILLVVGNIGWRMWCELIIVFFRINRTMSNIEDNTRR